jgi:hypothetical protein
LSCSFKAVPQNAIFGEPIVIELEITNVSIKPVLVTHRYERKGPNLLDYSSSCPTIDLAGNSGDRYSFEGPMESTLIQPSQKTKLNFYLTREYKHLKPGDYKLEFGVGFEEVINSKSKSDPPDLLKGETDLTLSHHRGSVTFSICEIEDKSVLVKMLNALETEIDQEDNYLRKNDLRRKLQSFYHPCAIPYICRNYSSFTSGESLLGFNDIEGDLCVLTKESELFENWVINNLKKNRTKEQLDKIINELESSNSEKYREVVKKLKKHQ